MREKYRKLGRERNMSRDQPLRYTMITVWETGRYEQRKIQQEPGLKPGEKGMLKPSKEGF